MLACWRDRSALDTPSFESDPAFRTGASFPKDRLISMFRFPLRRASVILIRAEKACRTDRGRVALIAVSQTGCERASLVAVPGWVTKVRRAASRVTLWSWFGISATGTFAGTALPNLERDQVSEGD